MKSCIKYFIPSLLLCVITNVAAVPVTGTLTVNPGTKTGGIYTGGSYFAMGGNTPNSGVMLRPLSTGPGGIVLGTYQNFVLNPNVPHPYNWNGTGGSAGTGFSGTPTTASDMLQPFSYFGTATYVGTNPISYQSGNAHPVPTANVDLGDCVGTLCTLTMDLSSWEVMWNGSAFEQGPRPVNSGPFVLATGTYDIATGFYSVTWASQINGGPFNAVVGYWHLDGTGPILLVATPETVVNTAPLEMRTSTGCSLTSGKAGTSAHAEWALLAGFLVWLGAIRHRKRHHA